MKIKFYNKKLRTLKRNKEMKKKVISACLERHKYVPF